MNVNIPWFILLCPLLSAAFILLFARRAGNLAALVSVFAVCCSFVGAVVAFLSPDSIGANQFTWIKLGTEFSVPIGLTIDALSKVMLLVVTGVGALVHIYSLAYMEEDDAKARFFGGLSLFMFSMLGIVLADNFVMMFIFWELVGVSVLPAHRPLVSHANPRRPRRTRPSSPIASATSVSCSAS